MYQEAADIRDVYLYKKFAVQVGSWYTGGGERCSIDKKCKYEIDYGLVTIQSSVNSTIDNIYICKINADFTWQSVSIYM